MIRTELRIIFAALAVFVALVGLFLTLDGLVLDAWPKFRYGAATLVAGIVCFVLLLNPGPGDHD